MRIRVPRSPPCISSVMSIIYSTCMPNHSQQLDKKHCLGCLYGSNGFLICCQALDQYMSATLDMAPKGSSKVADNMAQALHHGRCKIESCKRRVG